MAAEQLKAPPTRHEATSCSPVHCAVRLRGGLPTLPNPTVPGPGPITRYIFIAMGWPIARGACARLSRARAAASQRARAAVCARPPGSVAGRAHADLPAQGVAAAARASITHLTLRRGFVRLVSRLMREGDELVALPCAAGEVEDPPCICAVEQDGDVNYMCISAAPGV